MAAEAALGRQVCFNGESINHSFLELEKKLFSSTHLTMSKVPHEWVTVRKATTCTHKSDEYQESFKGTVRTPSVASGRGYCPNCASGVAGLRPFCSTTGQPSKLRGREGL